jgi:hypothetical protein
MILFILIFLNILFFEEFIFFNILLYNLKHFFKKQYLMIN